MDALKYLGYFALMTRHDLDATGLLCPLPVLKARKRLTQLNVGDILHLRTDDPAAVIDVPHFCAEAGHELLEQSDEGSESVFQIKKR